MNSLMERRLRRSWRKVPVTNVKMYDWHSPAGQQFLRDVAAAVENDEDIHEIGALTGIRNFSDRWRILSRKVQS